MEQTGSYADIYTACVWIEVRWPNTDTYISFDDLKLGNMQYSLQVMQYSRRKQLLRNIRK